MMRALDILSVAAVAVGGDGVGAVAVQTGAHGMDLLAVGVGMALCTGVTGGGVLPVVKVDIGGEGCFSHPAQGLGRMGGVVWIGSGVQGQQARIVCQYMAVAVQAGGGGG